MEEYVGKLWHNWVTKTSGGHYPEAAVKLADIEKTAGILFRAFGGDPGLKVAAATAEQHGARRSWLQRLAGSGEKVAHARRDAETLRLPPEIAVFPDKALNRDLYLWLAALAASDVAPGQAWFIRNQRASQAALARYPGLRSRYKRLVDAHIAGRLPASDLLPDEAAQEEALRQAMRDPGTVDGLPPLNSKKSRPPQPVLLWLIASEESTPSRVADPDEELPPEGTGNSATSKEAHKAEQVETPDNKNPMLAMFRAESLPTWAEYVRVNRAFDEDEDPNARDAAKDLDKLSLIRDGQTAKSRVKFDLDLPSAAEDDTPIGPGIALPEWDYRKELMQERHCLLQPMVASDAEPAALPAELAATAKKLRGQFAALAPQRRWLKAQPDGPELDVDSCVRNHADRASGHTPETGGYLAQARCERDLACLLLADLSMSTDAPISDSHRIIDVIRDSLLLFSEALTATGDRFGIYGFSSLRRQNIRFHLLKDFAGKYDAAARGRILAVKPGYYTRMGAAIRQSANILAEQPAGRRLLLIITDGKPNDLDIYDSRYGIEDTRMAVHEARRMGLTPFCVTIDHEAGAYLPYLFGPAGFCVIRKPEELPRRLPLLYVQLTRQ
ncbi:nitric oxide reductase activation protein NorD [Ferribacterium limneticum]|uniref:nitric oxide reductase activation protein NorD n=1 Tax=Ferribacterium limneticum TaxID=76259 RepID=UPI001CFBBBF2|nr:VWA domain-containing protein [Ferribacterium limneticum]UCV29451.1 VWA domain-containing protein [Ferribacterium limneticum]UCV33370.1 VWA domain-containing protein [Ferribacterium limneticum]